MRRRRAAMARSWPAVNRLPAMSTVPSPPTSCGRVVIAQDAVAVPGVGQLDGGDPRAGRALPSVIRAARSAGSHGPTVGPGVGAGAVVWRRAPALRSAAGDSLGARGLDGGERPASDGDATCRRRRVRAGRATIAATATATMTQGRRRSGSRAGHTIAMASPGRGFGAGRRVRHGGELIEHAVPRSWASGVLQLRSGAADRGAERPGGRPQHDGRLPHRSRPGRRSSRARFVRATTGRAIAAPTSSQRVRRAGSVSIAAAWVGRRETPAQDAEPVRREPAGRDEEPRQDRPAPSRAGPGGSRAGGTRPGRGPRPPSSRSSRRGRTGTRRSSAPRTRARRRARSIRRSPCVVVTPTYTAATPKRTVAAEPQA